MNATTLFMVGLLLLVGCAVLAGELISRLGQAALVGQLTVGIIFGPTLLGPYLGLSNLVSQFTGLQILATFFVLLTAGLAITPRQFRETGVVSGMLGIAIFLIPFLTGTVVVHYLYPGLAWSTTLFVALTISITAIPVLGVMLAEFRLAESQFGTFLMNGAVVNELAAVTTFSVLLRISANGGSNVWGATAVSVLTVAVFLTSILAVHFGLRSLRHARLWDRMVDRVRNGGHTRELGFALLMVGGLAAAVYSQELGLTYLVGAFYAGLLISEDTIGPQEHRKLRRVLDAVTWGFFIPLFFALVGFGMDLRLLVTSPLIAATFAGLCIFAFFSKLFVGAAVTRSLGWAPDDALGAGFLVASRGAVELAMATVLLSLGIFDETTFTIVAGVGLVTTFLSPIGARSFVRHAASATAPAGADRPWLSGPLSPTPAQAPGPRDPP